MEKDFDTWTVRKKEIDSRDLVSFHPKEIWWCAFGVNVGREQNGRGDNFERPIIILKKS